MVSTILKKIEFLKVIKRKTCTLFQLWKIKLENAGKRQPPGNSAALGVRFPGEPELHSAGEAFSDVDAGPRAKGPLNLPNHSCILNHFKIYVIWGPFCFPRKKKQYYQK